MMLIIGLIISLEYPTVCVKIMFYTIEAAWLVKLFFSILLQAGKIYIEW